METTSSFAGCYILITKRPIYMGKVVDNVEKFVMESLWGSLKNTRSLRVPLELLRSLMTRAEIDNTIKAPYSAIALSKLIAEEAFSGRVAEKLSSFQRCIIKKVQS